MDVFVIVAALINSLLMILWLYLVLQAKARMDEAAMYLKEAAEVHDKAGTVLTEAEGLHKTAKRTIKELNAYTAELKEERGEA